MNAGGYEFRDCPCADGRARRLCHESARAHVGGYACEYECLRIRGCARGCAHAYVDADLS